MFDCLKVLADIDFFKDFGVLVDGDIAILIVVLHFFQLSKLAYKPQPPINALVLATSYQPF